MLLEAIRDCCGYDFSHYTRSTLLRRLNSLAALSGVANMSDLIPMVFHDEDFQERLIRTLSITVTHMFRDPSFFLALQQCVFPAFQERKSLKIWHAGCATGEEVFSLAILLQEAGLYDRATIFATDINSEALDTAATGIYSIPTIQEGTRDYQAAGGAGSLADYYHSVYGAVKMKDDLKTNVVFSHHDLVTGSSFGQMDLILCRNVTIYFDHILQERVYGLFADSLTVDGYLGLGSQESLNFSSQRGAFADVGTNEKLYRQIVSETKPDAWVTGVGAEVCNG